MTIIAYCTHHGIMVQDFQGGSRLVTQSIGLTETKQLGTIEEAKQSVCMAICDAKRREACKILDNL